MSFVTTVHVAGQPDGMRQKCMRCGLVLIDAMGCMSTTPGPLPIWNPGGFVGTVGNCSFMMDHDAIENDELKCTERVN